MVIRALASGKTFRHVSFPKDHKRRPTLSDCLAIISSECPTIIGELRGMTSEVMSYRGRLGAFVSILAETPREAVGFGMIVRPTFRATKRHPIQLGLTKADDIPIAQFDGSQVKNTGDVALSGGALVNNVAFELLGLPSELTERQERVLELTWRLVNENHLLRTFIGPFQSGGHHMLSSLQLDLATISKFVAQHWEGVDIPTSETIANTLQLVGARNRAPRQRR